MNRRTLDFRTLDELEDDLRRLRDAEYDRAGRWSLARVCDHLAIFFRGSLDGFDTMLPWIVRVTVGAWMWRSILKRRGFREGIQAPKVFLPGEPRDDRAAADELLELVQRFRGYQGESRPSPLFGQLTREQWTELHLIHSAHHLSFLVPRTR